MSAIKFLPLDLGSALLGGFFQALFDRLMPHSFPRIIVTEKELRSEINGWFSKLAIIQAALDDAEEKQWTNMAVKMWLDDLRDFAYDLEDLLDERNTDILKRSLNAQSNRDAISKAVEELKTLWANFNRMSNSTSMTQRLEELCEQRSLLGLIERTVGRTVIWQRPPSTCLPTEPDIFGRGQDKKIILEMMSDNDETSSANFRVVSIVGMAGIGKTTLAKEVYNDTTTSVMKNFNQKAWISVSNNFDVFRMSKSILESINPSTRDLKDLNEVQVQLKSAVNGQRFLLVLDDVWSKNYDLWETFKSPFVTGARGSRIIVTTRRIDVALTMGSGLSDYYNLRLLSGDDCWSVFQVHAFESRNIDAHPSLKSVRDKVIQKCGGLPLAARTLGRLLRSKHRNDEWEDILSSRIWDLTEDSNILPVLKLSYHHLPSHLKRCFAYCAILPKNCEFEEKELVLFWIAEGLILPSADNKPLEDIGCEYFHDLLSMSIFQQSSGDASKFVMHNLFNDLAQWISGETSFRLGNEPEVKKKLERFKRVRHFSYNVRGYDGKNKFQVFDEVRTFLPILTHNLDCYLSNAVVFDLLPKFKKLRVLSLRKYRITELPDSIGKLRYLRYLNLADTEIASLPESITDLINLQIMILRNCSKLSKLFPSMGKLISLRHLDIEGITSIREMPSGMQEIKYLETLSNFIVGEKDSGSHLKELKNLKLLRGELHISQLENVTDSQVLGEAILSDKKYLQVLILEWGMNNPRNEEDVRDVLDMLRPHTNLLKLTINHYGGSTFPSWIEDPSFSNIEVLRLEGCEKCTSLPSLGVLSKLKELAISRMNKLTAIDSRFYGSCSKPFQSLEILYLEDLPEWSSWEPIEDNVLYKVFGHLSELSIVKCPKISRRFPAHLPSLQKLVIQECAELEVSISSVPTLSLPSLQKLVIQKCAKLEVSISSVPTLSNLETDDSSLNFMSVLNISRFGNWFRQACSVQTSPETPFLSSLNALEIKECNDLKSLQGIMKHSACLGRLVIESCDSLTSIAEGQLPSSLKRLEISSCKNLQCLLDGGEDTNHSNASLVEYLYVSKCYALKSLSSRVQLSETLQHLEIKHCSRLTTLGKLAETLERLEIQTCRKLDLSSGQLPASLEHLSIYECPIGDLFSTGQLPASLQYLKIEYCSQLTSLSSGQLPAPLKYLKINSCESLISIAGSLQNLSSLREIDIFYCPSLESFPEVGLSNSNLTILSIKHCDKLDQLPSIHTLNSLKELHILDNKPSSFPQQGFPSSLTSLSITGLQFYDDQVMKRLHKLTSLRSLHISGCVDAKSFPEETNAIILPTCLTHLALENFVTLESLSPEGFRNLTSLEYLSISKCSALTSFPKEGLLSSLLELHISECSQLKDYCLRYRGRDKSEMANIPYVKIDGKFIHPLAKANNYELSQFDR